MSNNVGYIETLLRRAVGTFFFVQSLMFMVFISFLSKCYPILAVFGLVRKNLIQDQMYWMSKLFLGTILLDLLNIEVKMVTPVSFNSKEEFLKTSPFILLFSHASFLDGLLMLKMQDSMPNWRSVGKKVLFQIPLFRTVLRGINMIPLNRSNRQEAIKSINELAKKCKREKFNLVISPEGTRRRKPSVDDCEDNFIPFKKGPFHLACDNNLPIRCLLIVGNFRAWPYGQIYPNCSGKNQFICHIFKGTILMKISEIIPKEVVATMDHNELRLYCRKKFVEFQSLKDYEIVRKERPKKQFWFVIISIWVLFNLMAFYKLLSHFY